MTLASKSTSSQRSPRSSDERMPVRFPTGTGWPPDATASGIREQTLDQQRFQFARLEHLAHNIGAANKLAPHVELGHGRPVRKAFDAGAYCRILEYVDPDKIDPEVIQDLHNRRRKPAFRRAWLALHEKDNLMLVDRSRDGRVD